jgi:BirA family transcriptional regulator, biotin operon repressor / biotin---[acetyl-CoA-carboxylase] ligase
MIGLPRVHWRLTDSTNERAKDLAARGAPHGTLVTADEQSAGRGRQGRVWTAPARSAVLMSLVVRDPGEVLPLIAAVAICDALPLECAIKWPNDVWLDRRKLAGILVEGRPQQGWAVLGVGLNVRDMEFPDELRESAISLQQAGVETDVEGILGVLLPSLDRWLRAPPGAVLDAWRERDAIRGESVRWASGEGIAAGIDDSGALLVDSGGARIVLQAGEVHLLR